MMFLVLTYSPSCLPSTCPGHLTPPSLVPYSNRLVYLLFNDLIACTRHPFFGAGVYFKTMGLLLSGGANQEHVGLLMS